MGSKLGDSGLPFCWLQSYIAPIQCGIHSEFFSLTQSFQSYSVAVCTNAVTINIANLAAINSLKSTVIACHFFAATISVHFTGTVITIFVPPGIS
jgi:hypothetical protein